jgi:hypothetical protein
MFSIAGGGANFRRDSFVGSTDADAMRLFNRIERCVYRNLIRIDLVTESLNISRDDRDAMFRLELGCLVLQISEPA